MHVVLIIARRGAPSTSRSRSTGHHQTLKYTPPSTLAHMASTETAIFASVRPQLGNGAVKGGRCDIAPAFRPFGAQVAWARER